MRSQRILTWLLMLGLMMSAAPAASALQQRPSGEGTPPLGAERRAELMERWQAMDDAERARMVERFERLRSLSPEEQQRARQQARRLTDELPRPDRSARRGRDRLRRIGADLGPGRRRAGRQEPLAIAQTE